MEKYFAFNILNFMKSKLRNRFTIHLDLVFHMFSQHFTFLRISLMILPFKNGQKGVHNMDMMHNVKL